MFKLPLINAVIFVLLLAGCTSKPREVSASIPLVSASQTKPTEKEIPSQYWSLLSNPQQSSLEHEKYKIELEALYISALGTPCRELKITDETENVEKRVACEIPFINANNEADKAWFMEKQIIESSAYIEL
ncbi:hypothetical protein CW745_03705 [Psychromonas sp. psych-6C06]|uniref:hypothetical protein n=1 Tax=Psychromonas sp. psych-6C06 TaxID=2058089 RepID=UPI000C33C80F|nr:hypothetical protein [Psychromonas sp. psych-6C06]PKF62542.1 hypothetical protein CW745_03705 [Psychromonas sp. psych-6C06]